MLTLLNFTSATLQINTDPMKSQVISLENFIVTDAAEKLKTNKIIKFTQIGYLDVVIPPDFIPEDTSSDVIVSI